ncbi:MAG: carboxypeptidase regulatory-like domain-containing protein [Pyrinomonadaceae bacterium]
MFGRILSRALALTLLIFAFSLFLAAQDLDDVTISGRVTDSNGLAVVGANVTATSVETGEARTLVTDEDGRYRFLKLKPGTYKVKTSATGFGTQETPDIPTISAQNLQKDFKLAPADVRAEQTVTVTEDSGPAVDTTRTIVGGTITEREIEEIPNNTRNALDLVLTLGGTSEEALSVRDLAEDRNAINRLPPTEQGNFSLSGGSSYSNNITVDGLDNNDDRAATDRFKPSQEAIAEVQVITNQFSAEYGRASGGRINLRTRAGNNKFRGRAFMFFRDDNLNANTYYNKQTLTSIVAVGNTFVTRVSRAPLARNPYTEYNPGFTLSGPVIIPFGEGKSVYDGHNRTFFAVAYENLNLQDTTLIQTYLPANATLNPNFTFPASTGGNPVCENTNSTSAANCINGGAAFVVPYNKSVATPNLNNTWSGRVDHKLFRNNDITFGLQFGRRRNQRQNIAFTTRLEEALQGTSADTEAYNITDNHVFGSRTVNQFRFQYSTFKPAFVTENPGNPVVLLTYADPTTPTFTSRTLIAGNSSASSASGNFADKREENRFQFQDSVTHLIGSHSLKFGFDVQRVNSMNLDTADTTGTYNFGNSGTGTTTADYNFCPPGSTCPPTAVIRYLGMKNFELNQVTRFRQNFGTDSTIKNTYIGFFGNDEFRLKPSLTVSYGLRYERETILSDKDNFGPRFGVAWDPFKKGTGVVRFGAGIFYNRVLLRTIDDFLVGGVQDLFDTANVPGTALRLAVARAFSSVFPRKFASAQAVKDFINPVLIANGGQAGQGFTNFDGFLTRFVDTTTLKIPESYQFNVGFEREVAKAFVFEANYTWNKTVHLWGESNPNAPNLGIANSRLGTSYPDWTAYLEANNFLLGSTTYNFVRGSTTDAVGTSAGTPGVNGCPATGACTLVNLDTINPSEAASSPIGLALQAVNQFRPKFPNLNQQQLIGSDRKSFYQGLILEFRSRFRRFGNGFRGNFRAAYTLSKLMDDGLNNTSDAESNGDFGREWSRALQDRRHRFALTGTLELPGWLGKLRLSPLFRYGSSAPFNISYSGIDRNLDDIANDRQNFTGNLSDIKWREPGSPVPTALLAQFSLQPIGAKGGNLPRNAGNGPKLLIFDMNFTREFRLGERVRIRPNAQIGNIFNMTVLSYGSGFIDYSTFGTTAANQASRLTYEQNFLVPLRAYRPREVRLGMRVDF